MAKPRPVPAFHIDGLGTRYALYVDAPDSLPDNAAPWITVLCLDGDDQFVELVKAREILAKEALKDGSEDNVFSRLLLVGIGYGASYGKPGNRRARDYTSVAIEEEREGGGAEAFLEFVTTTVWPEIARRYPVHPTIRGLTGYSLGGLLALLAVFKPKPFFNRVLAASPSIWWGDRAVLSPLAVLQDSKVELPADTKLFFSVGLKDSKSMTGDLELMETQFNARPVGGLEVSSARFPDHTHFNAIAVSFRTGLTALFGRK